MDAFTKGISNAVRICMAVRPGEKVLVISDRATRKVSGEIISEAGKITDVASVVLEDLGKRPLKKFPRELGEMINRSDVTFYAAQSFPGEIYPFRRKMLDTIIASRARHAHMPNITPSIVRSGLAIDNVKVQHLNDRIFGLAKKCRQIWVRGGNGTFLTADFDSRYRWVNLGSVVRGSDWTNLPGAEVMTFPANVNGIYVADGVLGDHFVKYGKLDRNPVYMQINDGRVVSLACDNPELEEELTRYLSVDRNSTRVGEFALGTNIFLKSLSGILLQDEKFPTVHIALGNPYPNLTGAPYRSKTHLDAVTKDVSVWIDGQKVMEEGKYLII